MSAKYTPPVIDSCSFSCPHCGTLAHQNWLHLYAVKFDKDSKPNIPDKNYESWISTRDEVPQEAKNYLISWAKQMHTRKPFTTKLDSGIYSHLDLHNVFLSQCYSCNRYSIWLHDSLIYPEANSDIQANQDLPDDILQDFNEAKLIVDNSPRGAAALLRLAIQKLCKELGETGNNINQDIANLVTKGLDKRIQQALDIVRVIGNNAVHPGKIDFSDSKKTALELFKLVNLIADSMISQPKQVEEMYGSLPEEARKAIEVRDQSSKKPA